LVSPESHGFGFSKSAARPKPKSWISLKASNPGLWRVIWMIFGSGLTKSQASRWLTIGLALALVSKPKSHVFLARGQSQDTTTVERAEPEFAQKYNFVRVPDVSQTDLIFRFRKSNPSRGLI
jgi:hypothetical protein